RRAQVVRQLADGVPLARAEREQLGDLQDQGGRRALSPASDRPRRNGVETLPVELQRHDAPRRRGQSARVVDGGGHPLDEGARLLLGGRDAGRRGRLQDILPAVGTQHPAGSVDHQKSGADGLESDVCLGRAGLHFRHTPAVTVLSRARRGAPLVRAGRAVAPLRLTRLLGHPDSSLRPFTGPATAHQLLWEQYRIAAMYRKGLDTRQGFDAFPVPYSSPLRTRRSVGVSIFEPDRTTATLLPASVSRSLKRPASPAAPAPSARLCVARRKRRRASAISASDTVTKPASP